jgi:hypothetical protein
MSLLTTCWYYRDIQESKFWRALLQGKYPQATPYKNSRSLFKQLETSYHTRITNPEGTCLLKDYLSSRDELKGILYALRLQHQDYRIETSYLGKKIDTSLLVREDYIHVNRNEAIKMVQERDITLYQVVVLKNSCVGLYLSRFNDRTWRGLNRIGSGYRVRMYQKEEDGACGISITYRDM